MTYIEEEYNCKRCPKCTAILHKYRRCPCDLKDPKRIKCRIKYKECFYTGWLQVTWNGQEDAEDIDIIWERDIYDNPFKYSVVDIDGNYYNLAFAKKIYIMEPDWVLYHKKKDGDLERCYCSGETTYLEDEDWK